MQTTDLDFFSMRREFHIEIKEISLICFHFLPPNTSRWDAGIHNRCSSLCCCLYSTSCFRLQHTEQRADSIYWIHKNNKPIKNDCMNNSIASPEETISLILLHNQWNSKMSPCFLCSRDWSLLHSLVGIPNLEVRTAGNIWWSCDLFTGE